MSLGIRLGPDSPLHRRGDRATNVAQGAVAKREGRSFEQEITATNDAYAAMGLVAMTRAHPPVAGPPTNLHYAGDGDVDFVGHVRGIPVAFDTKSDEGCASYKYYERDMHELDFLLAWRRTGGVAFVLLLDRARETLYLIDHLAALRAGKSVPLRTHVRSKSGAQTLVPALIRTASERTLDAAMGRPIWPWFDLAKQHDARLADAIALRSAPLSTAFRP
jgi:penicillin-binding protein-related factor A (putative recombinase)